MINLNHNEHWYHLANPGHEPTRNAISKILSSSKPRRVLNCAATLGPATHLTEFKLPQGLTVEECLRASGSGIIPKCLRQWNYEPKIRPVKQLPCLRPLPEKYLRFDQLPWFQCATPATGLGINARHLRYNHGLWQELKPKVLRSVHTTLVLALPQIGYSLAPHIQLEKSFLYWGALARGLCATQLFPARYLFPEANLGNLAQAPAPIFADLLPATGGYAWPCVEREPDPWRVLTHYENCDRYYGYPFRHADGREDVRLKGVESGAMLLPNGARVSARHSESLAYATLDPQLHRELKLNADGFEALTGLSRGTVTHDSLPFLLPVPMQCQVYAVIVGQWEMQLDRPGDLTSYSVRTQHAAIRGFHFYQRVEPFYSNFMRLVNQIASQPDFAAYPLASHLTDSWLGGNLRLSNQQSRSEKEFGPEFVRHLHRQQLDWQLGVTNLMNHLSFRSRREGAVLRSLSGEEIERQFGIEGLVFHQMQNQLRFDSHLFQRQIKPASLWPDQHVGWTQMDQQLRDVALPKL